MLTLAIAYLRDRPLTTILNILLLAISVAMLVLLLQFGSQFEKRFENIGTIVYENSSDASKSVG